MTRRMRSHVRWLAFLAGGAVAVLLLASWQVAGGASRAGATITLEPTFSMDVDLQPAGTKFTRTDLRPSRPDAGLDATLTARNATGHVLVVRLRTTRESGELDRVVALRVGAGRRIVFEGRLGDLRRGTAPFTLPPDTRVPISVRAWIPTAVDAGFEARADNVALELVPAQSAA